MSTRIGNRSVLAIAVVLTLFVGMDQAPKPKSSKPPARETAPVPPPPPEALLLDPPPPSSRDMVPIAQDNDKPTEEEAAIKPLPLVAIPDNPPHEGALFRLEYRIEPPDLVLVEVLEALPGRPITGERLVLTDGTVSLGFYGHVKVAGLTTKQAKEEVTLHMRKFLTDQTLGLVKYSEQGGTLSPPGTVLEQLNAELETVEPFDKEKDLKPDEPEALKKLFEVEMLKPSKHPSTAVPTPSEKKADEMPNPFRSPIPPNSTRPLGGTTSPVDQPKAGPPREGRDQIPPPPVMVGDGFMLPRQSDHTGGGGRYVMVDPQDTDRVFVDVAAYNTSVYYVLGDFAKPGRLPITGSETVLDAIQFSGGLQPSADSKKIVLHRPERGGKPAREYKIDLDAIHRGIRKANLQLFPGDRLVVGRKDEYLRPVVSPKKSRGGLPGATG